MVLNQQTKAVQTSIAEGKTFADAGAVISACWLRRAPCCAAGLDVHSPTVDARRVVGPKCNTFVQFEACRVRGGDIIDLRKETHDSSG